MSNPSALPPPPPGVQFVDDGDALPAPPPGVTFSGATARAPSASTPAPDPHPWLHGFERLASSVLLPGGAASNVGAGVLKGAGQLLSGLDNTTAGRWINSYGGLRSPAATQAATDAYQRLTTPSGPAQGRAAGATRLAGNVAEGVMLPEAEGGVLARMAAQGLMGAGLSKINGGSATAGAVGGAVAEGAGSALRAVAPRIAEAALHVGGADRAYGKTPGLAMLEHTRGNTLAKIAQTARDALGTTGARIGEMADAASVPSVEYAPKTQLALPPGPAAAPEIEAVPLHQATATVEKASPLQPAMIGARAPILARDTGRVLAAPEQVELRTPEYRNATAMENVGAPTVRSAGDAAAATRQAELADNGGSIFIRPGGNGEVTHPMTHPLNTVQVTEPAQGVLLRKPGDRVPGRLTHAREHDLPAGVAGPKGTPYAVPEPPPQGSLRTTPEQAGFTLHQPTASLRPALGRLDSMIARVPRNNPTALKALQRVRAGLTEDMAGNAIPENVPPSLALELKQGLRREFAKYRGDPALDFNTASNASKGASRDIDHVLDKILGPEFTNLNQRYSSLKTVEKLADRGSRGAPLSQRVVHRLAAHTGALAGAGVGAALGYESGGGIGALKGGAEGLLLPEVLAGSPTLAGVARRAYAPVTKRLLRGAFVGGATAATK